MLTMLIILTMLYLLSTPTTWTMLAVLKHSHYVKTKNEKISEKRMKKIEKKRKWEEKIKKKRKIEKIEKGRDKRNNKMAKKKKKNKVGNKVAKVKVGQVTKSS